MSLPSMFDLLGEELASALLKTAEEKEPESKTKRVVKTVGSGLAGMGLGYLTGAGALHVADKLHNKLYGSGIPSNALMPAVPALGALSGLAYTLYKAQEQEEIRRALEGTHDQPAGRVPV